ncbi:hypothetical protein [Paraflavitalea pollutisoli]|uniref:hypothetical protein n=1 Tax=Paraflavitalea pollutisoli TaxID=3034143 RepID=UPI0023ED83EC|nr:hypothetical protein [Paraflavitalea sp. H1-2-19X]
MVEAKHMNEVPGINRYMPIAVLYFFLNSVLLPHGLLYTTLLTPVFLYWLYLQRGLAKVGVFFVVSIPYAIIHYYNGVDSAYYLKSTTLLFCSYVFCISFYHFLQKCSSLRVVLKDILLINFLLVIIALLTFPVGFLKDIFWLTTEITTGFSGVKRLQLLTYEPSYYSTLLIPIALYYYLKMMARSLPHQKTYLVLVTLPLLLSLSFGVISAILLALIIVTLPSFKLFFPKFANPVVFIFLAGILLLSLIIASQLFPDNLLFARINNVLAGTDTSFLGRTYDSFYLGWEIASEKSLWFGCGPGQAKLVGLDNYREFYNHTLFTSADVKIPNSLGDTLATYGLLGLLTRLAAEIVLFFKTKVYSNYYRLALFASIFIYQFTGSFITNIAEYVIWIMAFYPGLFTEFDKTVLNKHLSGKQNPAS